MFHIQFDKRISAKQLRRFYSWPTQEEGEHTMKKYRVPCIGFTLFSISLMAWSCVYAAAGEGNGDQWQFHLVPYVWLAGLDGTVATFPAAPPVDVDVDFSDVVDNVNGALFLVGEARKGRFGLSADIAYVDIEDDEATPGQLFSAVESETESWIVSVVGIVRVFDEASASVDILAGIRYWAVDAALRFRPGELPRQDFSNDEDWIDPIVGMRGLTFLGQSQFFLSGGLFLGGFGAGSDFMWDANFNLGYRWTPTFSTIIGYRYLDVDYEEGSFIYDVSQDGPLLGLSWRF